MTGLRASSVTCRIKMAASRGLQFLGRGVPEVARTNLLKNKTLVGGKWVEALSKRTYPVYNPVNSEVITEVRQTQITS